MPGASELTRWSAAPPASGVAVGLDLRPHLGFPLAWDLRPHPMRSASLASYCEPSGSSTFHAKRARNRCYSGANMHVWHETLSYVSEETAIRARIGR